MFNVIKHSDTYLWPPTPLCFSFQNFFFDCTLTHEFTHNIEGNILNAFVTCFNKQPSPSIRLMEASFLNQLTETLKSSIKLISTISYTFVSIAFNSLFASEGS